MRLFDNIALCRYSCAVFSSDEYRETILSSQKCFLQLKSSAASGIVRNLTEGRLAQLVRAFALHAKCRGFESLIAHQFYPEKYPIPYHLLPFRLSVLEFRVILSRKRF